MELKLHKQYATEHNPLRNAAKDYLKSIRQKGVVSHGHRERWDYENSIYFEYLWTVPKNGKSQIYNSPHVRPLFLDMLLAKDPPPPRLLYLWFPQLLYSGPDSYHKKMLDMFHCMDQVQLSVNPYSSVKPRLPVIRTVLSLQLFCTISNW